MDVDRRTRLKEIAEAGDAARRALDRAGLDYCCEGDCTLAEACDRAGVDVASVQEELHRTPAPTGPDWTHRGITALLDHVVGACHPRTKHLLAEAEGAARALLDADPRAREIHQAIARLVAHADEQMNEEEDFLFARVRALADARKARGPFPTAPLRTMHEHEERVRAGHARLHEDVRRVRALVATFDGERADNLRAWIDAASAALTEQMHLENNELIPRARDLEPNGWTAIS